MADTGGAVSITARILPEGAVRRGFGIGLYLHELEAIAATRDEAVSARMPQSYGTAADMSGAAASVREAGRIWFGQDPAPKNLVVGVRVAAAQPNVIWGADAANIADIQALGAGTGLRFAGNDITINPSGAADLAAVAALLQTAIRAITGNAFAAVTVAAADGALVVSSVADLLGTGFDDSSAARTLGLGGPGVNILEAMQAETVTAALDRIDLLNPDPYWVAAAPSIASDFAKIDAFRDWVAARPLQGKATIIDVFGSDVLAAAEGASIGARLHAQGGNNIGAIYNGDANQQAGLSYMARFSSVNFSAANSVINGKFLQLPGITPTRLTVAQRTELARKRINVYIPVGSSADTAEGQTFGTWIDVVYWLAWFSDALQTEGYTHIKGSETGIPITDRGLASIADALEAVCEEGVLNGGIAPNQVSPATRLAIQQATRNPDFDGFLATGYIVIRPRAADIAQSVRNARGPIPIKIYAKGSGKVNYLDIDVTLEN